MYVLRLFMLPRWYVARIRRYCGMYGYDVVYASSYLSHHRLAQECLYVLSMAC